MKIAIASCEELPGLDPEGQLFAAALREVGAEVSAAVWTDVSVSWADYQYSPDEFVTWARRVGARLWNPVSAVEWNIAKSYLRELSQRGVPVVPTRFVPVGGDVSFAAGEFVVKPVISAGSKDTARYGEDEHDRARQHVTRLQSAGREVMIQPYRAGVDLRSETALIFIDGAFSHGMRKGPLLRLGDGLEEGLFRVEDMSPREPNVAELELAVAATSLVREFCGDLLYARVDVIPGDAGPELLELELIEPSLFLDYAPGSAERLAAGVLTRASQRG
jgi:glutathione synthase/RimK-type ligase-like ATP-grasp enzyme